MYNICISLNKSKIRRFVSHLMDLYYLKLFIRRYFSIVIDIIRIIKINKIKLIKRQI